MLANLVVQQRQVVCPRSGNISTMSHCNRKFAISLSIAMAIVFGMSLQTWWTVKQSRLDQLLIHAVEADDLLGVRKALRRGADPNAHLVYTNSVSNIRDAIGYIIHSSDIFWHDCPILVQVAENGGKHDGEISQALLDAGADVNRTDRFGQTALMNAASGGRAALALTLLRNHADPSIRNNRGTTALSEATEYQREGVIRILKQRQ
jgi:hypothetical protein